MSTDQYTTDITRQYTTQYKALRYSTIMQYTTDFKRIAYITSYEKVPPVDP